MTAQKKTGREPIGIISHGTIGRMRRVGSDENGIPIEEQMPARAGIQMYDRDGGRVFIPTSAHRATLNTTDAERYKYQVIRDLLLEGFLREDKCPHTAVDALGEKAPVDPPPGFTGCKEHMSGRVEPFDPKEIIGGCVHLRAIVRRRRTICTRNAAMRKSKAAQATQLQLAKRLAEEATKIAENSPEGLAALNASRTSRKARTLVPTDEKTGEETADS
jgi:hypothetical protein